MSDGPRRNARATPPPPARKSLGQHFLTDPRILARIADAAQVGAGDTVVEIGPGRGALTEQLLARAGRVIAVEVDRALAAMLRDRHAGEPRLTIVERDVLEVPLGELAPGGEYALVGNIPYYITTPILFHALRPPRPTRAVFLLQREVAERMVAPPGSRDYGALSVNLQALARVEMLFRVAAGAFHPPPKVESAVVRVTPRAEPDVPPALEERFQEFVIAAFGLRRKQMRRVVRTLLGIGAPEADELLAAARLDPEARPETLSPPDFARLVSVVAARPPQG
ncbi:MAG TPA: 16S rRNA (adenine(1518)-N(6)/adenine(1519)-N(6))-dimethyltransferase RsmA [Gemmatimonadaceae bacterium]|nr:16S rRNA (adenine(1518)-N(6)/adenine(1519)-N(6))-dimethyltransferase RsmA [Gemmatimonadaceae bacterium]